MAKATKDAKWSIQDLQAAVNDVHDKKISIAHGIPKSTLYDYAVGKIEVGSCCGPDTVLTVAEEEKIVEYIMHMSRIGYGRTKEYVANIVKDILEKDGSKVMPSSHFFSQQSSGQSEPSSTVDLEIFVVKIFSWFA